MPYGTIKVDNITFTDNSVDKTISLSGLIQNPTFTGNVTATGTISGDVIKGGTTISGVTVTATTGIFSSGLVTAPSIAVGSGTSNKPGIYSPGTDQLALVTSGVSRLQFTSAGAYGIGGANYGTSGQVITSNGSSAAPSWQSASAGASISVGNTSATVTDTGTDGAFTVVTEGSTRLIVNNSGSFLYGGLTSVLSTYSVQAGGLFSGPSSYYGDNTSSYLGLTLWKSVNSASAYELTFVKTRGTALGSQGITSANDALGFINFIGSDGSNNRPCASIQAYSESTVGSTSSPGRLVFGTTTSGTTTISEKLRLDSNGFATYTGSIGRGAPVTKTGNFTLAIAENWIVCNGTATITATLPAASSWTGREVMLKTIAAFTVVSASSNVVPLAGGAAGTAILAATAGKYATLVSDGTNWIIMNAN